MGSESNNEIRCTLNLLALKAMQGMPQKEQIELMTRAGFDRNRIAELLDTTPHTVTVTQGSLKKVAKKRPGRRGRK